MAARAIAADRLAQFESRKQAILSAHAAGESVASIALKTGVPSTAVDSILRQEKRLAARRLGDHTALRAGHDAPVPRWVPQALHDDYRRRVARNGDDIAAARWARRQIGGR